MPAGLHAEPPTEEEQQQPKSDAQLRREAAKAQLEAEAEAESPTGAEAEGSLEGSTVVEAEQAHGREDHRETVQAEA